MLDLELAWLTQEFFYGCNTVSTYTSGPLGTLSGELYITDAFLTILYRVVFVGILYKLFFKFMVNFSSNILKGFGSSKCV